MSTTDTNDTTDTSGTGRTPLTIRATGALMRWRTIDLLTCAFLGVAFGVAYWAWSLAYQAPSTALAAVFPPLQGITAAPWLVAGVVGGLVVRRPGAALFCELIAAVVEALIGSSWGIATVYSGLLQGAGAELAFLLLAYASFGIRTAVLAGALSAPFEAVYEWYAYWADWGMGYKVAYLVILTASGAVVAGGLGWLLTRGLARAGALGAFPAGQEQREAGAV
ncbi:MAG: ECF transporter S component [Actinomycetota bacterium]|nr:ECF transporter S component [Actinomycetota bacterium]